MALQKITFDGSSVTSKRDADINHHLGGLVPAGIISGLGNECSVSVSNNYITFQDGYVQIYGRRIYVEANSQVYVSLDATKYGYVVIEVNLSNNTVSLKSVETTSSSYPSLTQQNLMTSGTLYQFPIAKYKKTTSSITLQTFTPTYIMCGLREVKLVKKEVSKMMEDADYMSIDSVTFDISNIPYDAILTFTFMTVDTLGYGGYQQVMGTFTIPFAYIYWSQNYFTIRSNKNYGKTDTFTMLISCYDFDKVVVEKVDTGYGPNCVYMSYYAVEEA